MRATLTPARTGAAAASAARTPRRARAGTASVSAAGQRCAREGAQQRIGRVVRASAQATGSSSDTEGYVNFQSRDEVRSAALAAAELNVRVPANAEYQQTIRRSVTYAGIRAAKR